MAIRSNRNLYPGVNPHLNSALQRPGGGWKGFHTRSLSRLGDELEPLLPSAYYVANEQSLQVGIYDLETDLPLDKPRLSIPDVTIYRSGTAGQEPSSESHTTPFTMTPPLPETVAER